MITKNCTHCGTQFEAKRSNAKYCRQSCRTIASYKRNGYVYRQGHYEKPAQQTESSLATSDSAVTVSHSMHGQETGRARDEVTFAGAAESFLGAGAANIISHQLTKGEYDERLAHLQQTLNKVYHELQLLNRGRQQGPQRTRGISTSQGLQKSGMPLVNFPTDPMM